MLYNLWSPCVRRRILLSHIQPYLPQSYWKHGCCYNRFCCPFRFCKGSCRTPVLDAVAAVAVVAAVAAELSTCAASSSTAAVYEMEQKEDKKSLASKVTRK